MPLDRLWISCGAAASPKFARSSSTFNATADQRMFFCGISSKQRSHVVPADAVPKSLLIAAAREISGFPRIVVECTRAARAGIIVSGGVHPNEWVRCNDEHQRPPEPPASAEVHLEFIRGSPSAIAALRCAYPFVVDTASLVDHLVAIFAENYDCEFAVNRSGRRGRLLKYLGDNYPPGSVSKGFVINWLRKVQRLLRLDFSKAVNAGL